MAEKLSRPFVAWSKTQAWILLMCNLLEVVLQSNSPLVVMLLDTLDLVLGVSFQLRSEGVLNTQQSFVNQILVSRTGSLSVGLAFFEVVASQEGPGVYVVRCSQLGRHLSYPGSCS